MIDFDLRGRAGVVTGAGKGIGAAIVDELATLGAAVVACSRTQQDLNRVVDEIGARGDTASSFVGDVTCFADMEGLAESCLETYGRLDFAVANAGMVVMGDMVEGDPASWRRLLETNVLGTAHTVRAVLPIMKQQKAGHIVFISSMSGRVTYTDEPMYVASKWALSGLGGCLRKESYPYNVRVTLIEPGLVDTPMISGSEEGRQYLRDHESLEAADCARAVAYALCQPPRVTVAQIALLPVDQSFFY